MDGFFDNVEWLKLCAVFLVPTIKTYLYYETKLTHGSALSMKMQISEYKVFKERQGISFHVLKSNSRLHSKDGFQFCQ